MLQVHLAGPVGPAIQLVTDDMPLLVESVLALLSRLDVTVETLDHPVFVVRRTTAGDLQELSSNGASGPSESWMHVRLRRPLDEPTAEEIERGLRRVLADVRQVAADSERIRDLQRDLAADLDALAADPPGGYGTEDVADTANLVRWLTLGHFTALGYRRYDVVGEEIAAVPGSGLGVLRTEVTEPDPLDLPGRFRTHHPGLLVLTQGALPSTIHRSVYPYFVGVPAFTDGRIVGEHRFLGVLTVTALHENILDIPVISRRVRDVLERAQVDMRSYTGQAMLETMQTLPRGELFAMDTDALGDIVDSVVGTPRRVRLFVRADPYGRYVSCLVYLPRDRYTTAVRLSVQGILLDEFGGGTLDYTARVSERDLALLHVTIRLRDTRVEEIDTSTAHRDRVRELIADVCRNWADRLSDAAAQNHLDPELLRAYTEAFPAAYREDFTAQRALADLVRLEALGRGDLDTHLYRPSGDDPRALRLALYVADDTVTLGRILPVLQSLGVDVIDERPYRLTRPDGTECWIYDFGLRLPPDVDAGIVESDPTFAHRATETFTRTWRGIAEADRFNRLVLRAGLTYRGVVILRAYAKYLRQTGIPYSQQDVEEVLLDAPGTARKLVDMFHARFDPDAAAPDREADLAATLTTTIDAVESLATDRILRGMFSLIRATTRTNFFVDDNRGGRCALVFKFDPHLIAELPAPRPAIEVFAYSPDVEGIHMRFGAVARGGLRWSDRREDFRTEVLGLAKAQLVKNAVIVPVGAKGGFVVKNPPAATGDADHDRKVIRERGESCYRAFISSLLDITDNLDDTRTETVPPTRVVRHDGDDTYLVVAADKGTATFSDLANEVSADYGYWLGDAFASGGSSGYDHKEMGITARGAWVSAQRHFRELGIDLDREPVTVAGIGDMSGDVFGNGMLLGEHLKLVAAFDHRHIFLDPDPDAARSFAERRRLFDLPRSSWADYDDTLISEGGGTWERTVKSVPIAAPARRALGLPEQVTELTPPELIRAILRAPVDMIWNGGIGTYIKAVDETHAQVGDKSNDAVRIDGHTVRARVVVEGGNLGVTQLGRIEYALSGGRINTDAIDNSAGVDSSDREVNIKILLDTMVSSGDLDAADRTELLASMTDEVSALVLADNIAQNELLGLERTVAASSARVHGRLIGALEHDRELDRALEALPTDAEIDRRAESGQGLTSPELSQLLAHVKLALVEDLLDGDLPDGDTFTVVLPEYFPTTLRDRFAAGIGAHPLRRRIVATILANDTVDRAGIAFGFRLAEETGASTDDTVRAYTATTAVFGLRGLWEEIDAAKLPTDLGNELLLETRRILERGARRLLSIRPQPLAVRAEISRYRDEFARLAPHVDGWMRGDHRIDFDRRSGPLVERGAPADLTGRVFRLLHQFPLLDVIDIADIAERDATEVAELYYALDVHLGVNRLLSAVSALERGDRWHSLARLALRDDLYGSLRSLTLDVLVGSEPGETHHEMIEDWELSNGSRLVRARAALDEIFESGSLDLAGLSVAARQIRSMVRGRAPIGGNA